MSAVDTSRSEAPDHLRLSVSGDIDMATVDVLTDAYRKYRERSHHLSLEQAEPVVDAAEFERERARVTAILLASTSYMSPSAAFCTRPPVDVVSSAFTAPAAPATASFVALTVSFLLPGAGSEVAVLVVPAGGFELVLL